MESKEMCRAAECTVMPSLVLFISRERITTRNYGIFDTVKHQKKVKNVLAKVLSMSIDDKNVVKTPSWKFLPTCKMDYIGMDVSPTYTMSTC